ncbi:Hvo_1808 family surface protein [Halorussus pelagicus]|uniref:Hvo_1808 family surface protein n=1 Tax=Halorussus pelagicus TaxID=2505977 RepID=UPI001AA017C3|nr:Hvo_1808 family surface protein [Halorussus pelagicus]
MQPRGSRLTAVLLVIALLGSGVAGATLSGADADATPGDTDTGVTPAEPTPSASAQDGSDAARTASCAATPPENGSDPDSDVRGWENGIWYDESIDVDQSDGVQRGERKRIVSRTMARVEAVRCVEFDQTVPVSVISREEFRRAQASQNVPERLRTFDNGKFEALLLVGEDNDSIAVQTENRGSGVLGFYSPQTDEIVVIAESAEELRLDELTLAHELMHAWQDQQFDLAGSPFDAKLRDQVNARNGLVEGDASYTETLYERRCSEGWQCLDAPERGQRGELANIGVYLLKFQPYSDGPAFVRMVRNVGGWDAVNAMYANLPASAEQVIHPLKYRSDPPTNVTLTDATTDAWERVRAPDRPGYARLGEAAVMMTFVYPYYDSGRETEIVPAEEWFDYNQSGGLSETDPLNYESNYSTGWDGDRLHVYENEEGELGYVWKLAWDSPQHAQQFIRGYQRVLEYWGGEQVGPNTWRIPDGGFADAFHLKVDGRNVTIVNAPTVEGLSEVNRDIGPISAANQSVETVADPAEIVGNETTNATANATTAEGSVTAAAS